MALLPFAPQATSAAPPALTPLYSFNGGADGGSPLTALAMGSEGVLYGTTSAGGTGTCPSFSGCGTVFSLTPPSSAGESWTETVLHNFAGGSGDGAVPQGVAIGKSGVLYGSTAFGGTGSCVGSYVGCGTVFSLTPPATPGGTWTEKVLHSFDWGTDDGVFPRAGVTLGPGDVLYGATAYGGTGSCVMGCGMVFSMTPPASSGGAWTQRVLYDFAGYPTDGGNPSGVGIGRDGVLYGTTYSDGVAGFDGIVYSLTPAAGPSTGAWTETVLHTFTGNDGSGPLAGVVMGTGGILYGTTNSGGASGVGTVFSLAPPVSPGGTWSEAVLHSFAPGAGSADPIGGVAFGSKGALYGTTYLGGTYDNGAVFELNLSSDGVSWAESVLHQFTGGDDGSNPEAGVVIGPGGRLYGTASQKGVSGAGVVFTLKP
ncbi:MAG: choice-of-anchor tandem repeat GloVer-containing protein [Bryobacteraceae bacterium]|jgi:uncharacterized repeat protein (TIGR03803 family)